MYAVGVDKFYLHSAIHVIDVVSIPSSNTSTDSHQSLTSYNIFLSVKLMSAADGMNRPSAVPTNCPSMNQQAAITRRWHVQSFSYTKHLLVEFEVLECDTYSLQI